MIKKMAKDVVKGDVIRPWISERTGKPTAKEYTVTGEPVYATHQAFSHYVEIPVIDKNGKPDDVFIFSEETVIVIK